MKKAPLTSKQKATRRVEKLDKIARVIFQRPTWRKYETQTLKEYCSVWEEIEPDGAETEQPHE